MLKPPMNNSLEMPIAETKEQVLPPEAMQTAPMVMPIGSEQLKKLTEILQKYKEGKTYTEQRVIDRKSVV